MHRLKPKVWKKFFIITQKKGYYFPHKMLKSVSEISRQYKPTRGVCGFIYFGPRTVCIPALCAHM